MDVDSESIVSSEKFVEHLWERSMHYSFRHKRVNVRKSAINDVS